MNSRAVVVHRDDAAEAVGSQGQALTPLVTSATAGATGLSGGFVRMPPGGVSRAREHAYSEIIVAVLSGDAATWCGRMVNHARWCTARAKCVSVGKFSKKTPRDKFAGYTLPSASS